LSKYKIKLSTAVDELSTVH